jgi:hypothetical protein
MPNELKGHVLKIKYPALGSEGGILSGPLMSGFSTPAYLPVSGY